MKSRLFEDFDDRAREVSKFFILIKNLEQSSIKLAMGNSHNQKIKNIDSDLEKTLKATGYLLLYNLVESTMRNAIEAIFDEIKDKEVSFDNLRDEIEKIVIENFKRNKKSEELFANITTISLDIVSASFDKQKLFSGNLDSRKIKTIASKYGFSYETNAAKTGNGQDLLTVKTHRNDLAHGFESFKEVGKEAGAKQLLQIQKRVISYLRGILENIKTYIDNQEYLRES